MKNLVYKSLAILLIFASLSGGRAFAESVLEGKTVVLLGDSNTWIGGDACDRPDGWNFWFAQGMNPGSIRSYARSGATWSHTSATTRNTVEYSEIITDDNVIYNQVVRLIEAVDNGVQDSPDLVMVAAGTNDAWFPHLRPEEFGRTPREALGRDAGELLALPPGKVLSLPEAVRYNLLILQGRFPDARFIVMTPIQSVKISSGMLADVSGIIEEVASSTGVSVIRQDMLCPVDSSREMVNRRLTTDGTHTSKEGARLNASVIIDCVNQIFASSTPAGRDI
ncbi:MAG: SGNH/GDSL hydrolase family protein [Muribaculaceae bacterium]|nr:SGNH/GDSL hydrolase family protein [Muribaculaceae bacterium]